MSCFEIEDKMRDIFACHKDTRQNDPSSTSQASKRQVCVCAKIGANPLILQHKTNNSTKAKKSARSVAPWAGNSSSVEQGV